MESVEYVTADPTCSLVQNVYPVSVKINDIILLRNNPCKIIDTSVCKTGKHGHTKFHFIGYDIFTGKRYEDIFMGHQFAEQPIVVKTNMKLLFIDDDGYTQLLNNDTLRTKEDLYVTDNDLLQKIKQAFNQNKEITVVVLSAMNHEMIIDYIPI